MDAIPTHVSFDHPGFAALGRGVFRLTKDDKVAALALQMDGSDVIVPLRAVATLFGIQADGADGRMLRLIEQGLRFVPQLALGDTLPTEVLTGEASWAPAAYHFRSVTAKLQLQLIHWINGATDMVEAGMTGQLLIESMDDPSIRPRIQEALREAAAALRLEGGPSAVSTLVEQLANELAFIEALRERLLERARAVVKRLTQANQDFGALAPGRRETLFQVLRLASTAAAELTAQFDEVDAQTSEILPALRNLDQQRSFLRPHRDRLYTILLGWEPTLTAWDALPATMAKEPEKVWRVIDETYRFLAPRYMTVQGWQTALPAPDRTERARAGVVW